MEANAHLDERAEESFSGLSSVKSSLSKTSTTARSSQTAEIRAKMTSAEIKAKQLALEEQRRIEEFEKQLEVKRKLELVQDEAERLKFKAGERTKTQEARNKAACLAAEAAIFEKAQMKIMTLKPCPTDCLILRTNLWNLNNQLLWWDTYPLSLNLSVVFPMNQK